MKPEDSLKLIEDELEELTVLLDTLEEDRDDEKKKRKKKGKVQINRLVPDIWDDQKKPSESDVSLTGHEDPETREDSKTEVEPESGEVSTGSTTTTSPRVSDPHEEPLVPHFKYAAGLPGTRGFDGKDFLVVERSEKGRPDQYRDRPEVYCKSFVTEDGQEMKVWCTKESWGLYRLAVEDERYRQAQARANGINDGTIKRPRSRYPRSTFIVASDPQTTAKDPNKFTVWYASEEQTKELNYYCYGANDENWWRWEKLSEEGWKMDRIQKHFNVKVGHFTHFPQKGKLPPRFDESLPHGTIIK